MREDLNGRETVLDGTFHRGGGGKGANQAAVAARLGARALLVGRVGDDDLGRNGESGGVFVAGVAKHGGEFGAVF